MFQFLFPSHYHNHITQQLDQIIAKLDTIPYDKNQETKPNKNIGNKTTCQNVYGLDKQEKQSNCSGNNIAA